MGGEKPTREDLQQRVQALETELASTREKLDSLWGITSLAEADIKTVADHTLHAITRLTESPYGFYGFLSDTEDLLTIHAWTRDTMDDCRMDELPLETAVAEAGIWAEAIRHRKPLILNDYNAPHPAKTGLPEGHVPITRLLVVPFMLKGRVEAVAAVANRKEEYTRDDADRILAFLTGIQAISCSKRNEEVLREQEIRYRHLAEHATDMISTHDAEGVYTYASPASRVLFGYEPEELLGRNAYELFHPEDVANIREKHDSILNGDTFQTLRYRLRHKEDHYLCVETTSKRILDADTGDVLEIIATTRDITESKEQERALRESEQRYRDIFETNRAVKLLISPDSGRIVDANPAAVDFYGYSKEELTSLKIWELNTLGEVGSRECMDQVLTGEQKTFEFQHRLANGDIRTVQVFSGKLEVGGETLLHSIVVDITKRKEMEEALRESEKRVKHKLNAILKPEGDISDLELADIIDTEHLQAIMNHFFELKKVGIAIVDMRGNVLVKNGWQDICTQFHRRHPVTCKNCIESDVELSRSVTPGTYKAYKCKNNMWDIATPIIIGGKQMGNIFLGQFFYEGEEIDKALFRKQARTYGFDEKEYMDALERVPRFTHELVDATMLFYTELAHLLSSLSYSNIKLARTLNERDTLLHNLEESEQKYKRLVENAPDLVYIFSDKRGAIYWSERVQDVLGMEPDELKKDPTLWQNAIHPEDRPRVKQKIDESVNLKPFEVEYRIQDVEGNWHWFLDRVFSIRRQDGETILEGIATDITLRKAAEQDRLELERKILEAQRADSLMTLAGGIAHDFNNLLVGVIGNAAMLQEEVAGIPYELDMVEDILGAAEQAADLSRKMLAYTGKGLFDTEEVSLNDLVQDNLRVIKANLPAAISLKVDLGEDLPPLTADETQLRQVVMNLVTNATEAIGEAGGILSLRTCVREYRESELRESYTGDVVLPGAYLTLEVADTGGGILVDDVASIFEPFYSTRFTGRGLGLAAVQGIVKGHRGAILVSSGPDQGTRIRILLPAGQPAAASRKRLNAVGTGNDSRDEQAVVLVVDDEPTVRTVAMRMLRRLGYQALLASTAEEGLTILKAHKDRIQTVLLDYTMPNSSAQDTLAAMQAINPDLSVVICSGYNAEQIKTHLAEFNLAGFLQKPFSLENLTRVLTHT